MERTSDQPDCNGEDRFSRLHDSVIHHIMSFNDTKCAVQTCVLSKRWIHVWKSLPFLNFSRSSFPNDKKHRFINFVDMVFLCRRQDFDIQRVNVCWENSGYDDLVTTNVNRWSVNAVQHNVQEISIVIDDYLHKLAYEMPYHLVHCQSLRKLEIRVSYIAGYVNIILPSSMSLPRLKEMILSGFSISNLELSKTLFSSCPVLETLDIIGSDVLIDNRWNLIVDSPSLKRFAYSWSCTHLLPQNDINANIIKLCAPNLEDFFCGFFLKQDYSLQISSPLSGVCFYVQLNGNIHDENAETYEKLPVNVIQVYATRTMKLLKAVYMVKEMRLSSGFLEVLSQDPDLLDCQTPRFCNLLSLALEMWSTRSCLRAVAYLLMISPRITYLFLESKESNLADVGNDWEAGVPIPGMLSHLKFVQMEEVVGSDAELKILSFLLKNARVLEKFALFFRSSAGTGDRGRLVKQFKNKLRLFPAASSSIRMVFKTSEDISSFTKTCNDTSQNIVVEDNIVVEV